MHPDVVLVWPSGTPDSVIEQLRRLGLRVESVPTYRLSDVPAALRRIGAMAGSAELAEQAALKFERDVAAQRTSHAGRKALTVFIEIDDEPVYTVNGEHVISEVVQLCGGRNVFAGVAADRAADRARVGARGRSAGDRQHRRHHRRSDGAMGEVAAV